VADLTRADGLPPDDEMGRAGPADERRVLLVASKYSPPTRVVAIRVNTWGRLLSEAGWSVAVATRRWHDEPDDEPVELHLLDPPPGSLPRRLLRGARARLGRRGLSLAVPDRVALLWSELAPLVAAVARETRPDVVVSSSPPHSVHLAGRAAAKAAGVPWVADFRDPLVGDPRFGATGLRRLRSRAVAAFERRVVEDAGLIVTAIPGYAEDLARRHPGLGDRLLLIPNGYPPALREFLHTERPDPACPRICAVGRAGDEEVGRLARAVAGVRRRHPTARLVLVTADSPGVREARRVLGDALVWTGRVRHDEALRQVAGANVLVSCVSVERSRVSGVSSRLYEYLATGRPLVAVNPTTEDRRLLSAHGALVLDRPDDAALEAALLAALDGEGAPDPDTLAAFRADHDRRAQVERLAAALEALVDGHARRR
jgi:hypothetical protein